MGIKPKDLTGEEYEELKESIDYIGISERSVAKNNNVRPELVVKIIGKELERINRYDPTHNGRYYSILSSREDSNSQPIQTLLNKIRNNIIDYEIETSYDLQRFKRAVEYLPDGEKIFKERARGLLYDPPFGSSGLVAGLLKPGIKTEQDTIQYLNIFHNDLSPTTLRTMLGSIRRGLQNPNLNIGNRRSYQLLMTPQKDLEDPKKRKRYLSIAAKLSSAWRFMPQDITVTKNDLNALAPVTRLEFLENFASIPNIFDDSITVRDIEEVLSLVGIKKTSRVSAVLKRYEFLLANRVKQIS